MYSILAIVICSDSRSALSSIRSDSTSAREDLVLEIGTVVHQLITRGMEVCFHWVPAHVCLSGNEMADRAAKRGARRLESQTLELKFGLADICSKLSRRLWRKREDDFRTQATAKEWLTQATAKEWLTQATAKEWLDPCEVYI